MKLTRGLFWLYRVLLSSPGYQQLMQQQLLLQEEQQVHMQAYHQTPAQLHPTAHTWLVLCHSNQQLIPQLLLRMAVHHHHQVPQESRSSAKSSRRL
jgi:hypothetical protein